MKDWLLDHGSDWFTRMGDFVGGPFYRLGEYCRREWWERHHPETSSVKSTADSETRNDG